MKKWNSLFFAFALLFAFACGEKGADTPNETAALNQDPIKIGGLFSISGGASFLGEPERNTCLMIVDQINAAGGINGRPVEMVIEDTESDDTKAVVGAQKLIKQEQVCAIVGPSRSGESMAVKPIADENQVPLISCAAAEGITNPLSPWVFKVAQKDSDCVLKLYNLFQSKGISKIAVMWENSGYGQSGRDFLVQLAPQMGITIVANETYGPKDTDMTAQLTRIHGTDAQAVVNWSVVPAQSIVPKNIKQLGMEIPLFQSSGFANRKYVEAAGEAAEGIVFPAGAILVVDQLPADHPRKAVLAQYKSDYETKFGSEVSTFGGHAYDGMNLVIEALKAVGPDRAKIRDYIETVQGYQGIAGPFAFSAEDHTGLTQEALELIIVKNGQFNLYQPES